MKIIFLIFTTFNLLFANINLDIQKTSLFDVTSQNAKINIANLKLGQSGVIIKDIDTNSIILSQAKVIETTDTYSEIEFLENDVLPQDAIPTSNYKPQDKDTFILNHLYNTSLLIVPNLEAKKIVQKLYPQQNFLNEDYFAAHLKVENTPLPQKEDIANFTQSQQIGTVFFVIAETLYIVDSLSFKIIDTVEITNNDTTTNSPFFTKIEDIKRGFWNFGPEKIENYNRYYSELLEIR